jgi:predicted phage terminase large subunit-like protein
VAFAAEEIGLRQEIRGNVTSWVRSILQVEGREPAAHHRLLLDELESICAGASDRLMILMPPGAAKSTYASILFLPWWLTRNPSSSIIAVSHTAGLSEHFGRQARGVVAEQGYRLGFRLEAGNRAAGRWRTSGRGEYFAAGVRGPITGRRADLALIDDPVKSFLEANNNRMRDGLWNWYQSDLLTRLKPNARIVLIMTRWHEDDIAGRMKGREGTQWRILRLPAFADENDPLGRPAGAALWPDWESELVLERKRTTVGERVWHSIYQQMPRADQERTFHPERIAVLDSWVVAEGGRTVRAWDLAATIVDGGNDPDWTVGLKLREEQAGRFVVLDIVRLRAGPNDILRVIRTTAQRDGVAVVVGVPEDAGQAGKTQVSFITRHLAGFHVQASRESGSKLFRAMPVASQIDANNVAILRADWNHVFLEELRDFPYGRKDDQVDALSRAFMMLTEGDGPARRIHAPFLTR